MADLSDTRLEARRCAGRLRLALSRKEWRGAVGSQAGAGIGSSIEFQDHRPYLPGDDPRHIDWAATARSDQAVMKVYREEVSPRIDLLVDTSASMSLTPQKQAQSERLLFFCIESARSLSASLHIHLLTEKGVETQTASRLLQPDWSFPAHPVEGSPFATEALPLRSGSLRIVLTDLLFPGEPDTLLRPLLAGGGRAMILSPYDPEEERPDWSGNMQLIQCESGRVRRQRISPAVLKRYQQAYHRHLSLWRDRCRAWGGGFARVPSPPSLSDALQEEALTAGVVEVWA